MISQIENEYRNGMELWNTSIISDCTIGPTGPTSGILDDVNVNTNGKNVIVNAFTRHTGVLRTN